MTPEAFATDYEIAQNNLLDGFEFLTMSPNDWLSCTLSGKSLSNDYITDSKQVNSSNKSLTDDISASIDCSTGPASKNNNESSYNSSISMCNSAASPNSETATLPHSLSSEPSLTNKWGKMPVNQTKPWKLSSLSRCHAPESKSNAILKTTMMSSFGANVLLKKQIRLQFRDFNTAQQSLDELDRIEMNINGAALWKQQIPLSLNSEDSNLESCKNNSADSDKSSPTFPQFNNSDFLFRDRIKVNNTDEKVSARTEQHGRKSGVICLNAKLPYINNRAGIYRNSNCNFHAKKLNSITIHSTSSVIRDNDQKRFFASDCHLEMKDNGNHANMKHHEAFAGLFYGKNPFKFLANNFLCENLLMNAQSNKTGSQLNSEIEAKNKLLINSKIWDYDI